MPLHLRHGNVDTHPVALALSSDNGREQQEEESSSLTPQVNYHTTTEKQQRKRKQKYSKSQRRSTVGSLAIRLILSFGALIAYVQFGLPLLSLSSSPEDQQSTRKTLLRDNEQHFLEQKPSTFDEQPTRSSLTSTTMTTTPLQDMDYSHYTVRINTWKRPDQLRVSIQHFLSCDRVALIQIVWCTAQGEPPEWLVAWQTGEPRIVVEAHEENSLNERFHVLNNSSPPPTKGILTIDDDVLRPCFAFDVAFAKWTSHPDRLVGFDARTHVIQENDVGSRWKYGYLSETTRSNRYSMTLTRCAFVHVDHLRSFTEQIPFEFRNMVTKNMNCEDILLSLWVTHLTDCQPPLLADYWAMKSMIKLYSPHSISGSSQHKQIRDECVDTFRRGFQLDDCLEPAEWVHHDPTSHAPNLWEAGIPVATSFVPSQASIEQRVQKWKQGGLQLMGEELVELIQEASGLPFRNGLIEGSLPWKEKYKKTDQ